MSKRLKSKRERRLYQIAQDAAKARERQERAMHFANIAGLIPVDDAKMFKLPNDSEQFVIPKEVQKNVIGFVRRLDDARQDLLLEVTAAKETASAQFQAREALMVRLCGMIGIDYADATADSVIARLAQSLNPTPVDVVATNVDGHDI